MSSEREKEDLAKQRKQELAINLFKLSVVFNLYTVAKEKLDQSKSREAWEEKLLTAKMFQTELKWFNTHGLIPKWNKAENKFDHAYPITKRH